LRVEVEITPFPIPHPPPNLLRASHPKCLASPPIFHISLFSYPWFNHRTRYRSPPLLMGPNPTPSFSAVGQDVVHFSLPTLSPGTHPPPVSVFRVRRMSSYHLSPHSPAPLRPPQIFFFARLYWGPLRQPGREGTSFLSLLFTTPLSFFVLVPFLATSCPKLPGPWESTPEGGTPCSFRKIFCSTNFFSRSLCIFIIHIAGFFFFQCFTRVSLSASLFLFRIL